MIDDRLPPQSLELEEYVLGEMFEHKAFAEWASANLEPEDWWRIPSREIFAAMRAVYVREGVLTPTLTIAELTARGQNDGVVPAYIPLLTGSEMNGGDRMRLGLEWGHGVQGAIVAGRKLREIASLRQLGHLGSDILGEAFREPWDLNATLAKAQDGVRQIAEGASMGQRAVSASEARPGFEAYLQERRSRAPGVYGMRFGIGSIDKPVGGLQDQLLVLVMGLSGFGKTTLATQAVFASALAYPDGAAGPVLVYMLEDSTEAFWRRWVQWRAGVGQRKLSAGGLERASDDEEARIQAAVAEMDGLPIRVTDDLRNIAGIEADVRNARMEGPVLGVLVDYAQLVTGAEGSRTEQQLTDVTNRLVGLANECKTTVILPSQVTVQQDGETSAKHAKSLGEGATMVVEVERGGPGMKLRERKDSPKVTIVCGKMRDGFQLGSVPVKGDFDKRRLTAVTDVHDAPVQPAPQPDRDEDPFEHDKRNA